MQLRTILAIISSVFCLSTTVINILILIAFFGPRLSYYRSHFFYVIFMVGVLIDIVALVNCHLLALLPSEGLFLDSFLSSTKLGRIWTQNSIRRLCFTMQFGIGIAVGLVAAVLNVYWCNTSGDSWYIQEECSMNADCPFRENYMIQIRSASKNGGEVKNEQSLMYLAICVCTMETMYYVMYYYGFVMNANFQLNLETVYVSYFLLTDLYSGLPPYLLLLFSSPIRQDVGRIISLMLNIAKNRAQSNIVDY